MKHTKFISAVTVGFMFICWALKAKDDSIKEGPGKILINSNFGDYIFRGQTYIDNHIDFFYAPLEGSYSSDRMQYSGSYGYIPFQKGKAVIIVMLTIGKDSNDQLNKEVYLYFKFGQSPEVRSLYKLINSQRVMITSEGQNTAWTHGNIIVFINGAGPRPPEYDQIIAAYLEKYPSDLKELSIKEVYELDKAFKLDRLQKLENERKTKTDPSDIVHIARQQCFNEEVIRRINGEKEDYCSAAVNFNKAQHETEMKQFISGARVKSVQADGKNKEIIYQSDNRPEKIITQYLENSGEMKKLFKEIEDAQDKN